MGIEWREHLALGISEIDNQHKELFKRFNSFLEACDAGEGGDDIRNMLHFLDTYVVKHFAVEEQLQREAGYPEIEAHQAQHRKFIEDLEALKRQVEVKGPDLGVVLSAGRLMVGWLIEHISKTDKALGQFLRGTGH